MTSVVKRIAWSTLPASTSDQRSSPGRIGSPAASADVHPRGRSLFDRSDHKAPEPAVLQEQPADEPEGIDEIAPVDVESPTVEPLSGLDAETDVFFDDSPTNVSGALAAGLPAYLFTSVAQARLDLALSGVELRPAGTV